MNTADYEQQLSAIHEAMTTIATHWNSHERRDLRLGAVRFLIQRYLNGLHGSTATEQIQRTVLRSLYEMSFPHQEYEDHTQVRARCWLIVEMTESAQQFCRKLQESADRTQRRASASVWDIALDALEPDADDTADDESDFLDLE